MEEAAVDDDLGEKKLEKKKKNFSDLRKCTKVFGYVSERSKRGRLVWLHRSSNWSMGSVLTPRMGNRLKNL